nr:MAG TPA: hypothetical protein [Caudoviricetes sp.]
MKTILHRVLMVLFEICLLQTNLEENQSMIQINLNINQKKMPINNGYLTTLLDSYFKI